MIFTEKLDRLMKQKNLTRGRLAVETGIPYTTLAGFYDKGKGYQNMKLANLKKISQFFDVSLDILADDERDLFEDEDFITKELAKKYAGLSEKGRHLVDDVVSGLLEMEAPARNGGDAEEEVRYIREYLTPAAAGYASPAEGEDYILVPRGPTVPKKADFAVRIAGDSMEPYIQDGSRVYVMRTNEFADGDVGIFFVDGDMKCKQFCKDSFGNLYLLSVNRRRADADMRIRSSGTSTVYAYGKVLLDKRIPLPNRSEYEL